MNGKMTILACITGFLLDCIFGDPVWMYHPIRVIGNLISVLEKGLRKLLCSRIPASEQRKKNKREVLAGGILWILTVSLSFLVPAVLLFAAGKVHPAVRFLLETFWCYQIFAARCLVGESRKVYQKLKEDDLSGARRAVSMIVGRDTENLTAEGVTKAAVETVAENTSDGVTAPLLFLLIGGAPLGFLYKAVNTMDSMLGYKNEKYLYFGRIPAKMDDVFNYIPARLTAWFMIVAAFLTGMDGKNAWKIYLRDKRKHASPNSAQSEAVCAGALDVQLAGDAVYFGKVYKKDYIGDAIRKIEPEDIIVAYDDIDLEVGQIRVRRKGSAGGHNGIKNIISHLGTNEFPRVKVGVGAKPQGGDLVNHVLGHFSKEDEKKMDEVLDEAVAAVETIVTQDVDVAMNRFNAKKK